MLYTLLAPFAAALVLVAGPSPVGDVYVDVNAAVCANANGGPANPVCSITEGVAIAAPGDRLLIAPGTYAENVQIGIDLELLGTGGAAVTIVDGQQLASVVVVLPGATVTLDGLTLTNGKSASGGGGVLVGGTLLLKNSTVIANEAKYGGGVSSDGADAAVVIASSTISSNLALGSSGSTLGGGVFQSGGSLTISNSTISNNDCTETYVNASPYYCYNYNYSFAFGGGISVSESDLVITDSTISGNTAYADVGLYAGDPGGGYDAGISAVLSFVEISNSTISGNSCYARGGIALAFLTPGSSISNTTITGNEAAIVLAGAPNSVTGGLWVFGPPIELRNTIIAQNTSPYGDSETRGPLLSLGHNLIGTGGAGVMHGIMGDLAGTPVNPIDAFFGPLQDNGGPTHTHSLLFGSPAIDAGDPTVFEPFDQRGISRPIANLPDMGSFESDTSAPSLCNGDGGDQAGCMNCPCGNNAAPGTIGGCINSSGNSTRLKAIRNPSVSLPPQIDTDLRFSLVGAPAGALCVLVSGEAVASQNMANPCFGLESGVRSPAYDGLRCAVLVLRRHGARSADSSGSVGEPGSPWGGEGAPAVGIAQAFGAFAPGQTRYFQVIHRENAAMVCMRGLTTSQAVRVVFVP